MDGHTSTVARCGHSKWKTQSPQVSWCGCKCEVSHFPPCYLAGLQAIEVRCWYSHTYARGVTQSMTDRYRQPKTSLRSFSPHCSLCIFGWPVRRIVLCSTACCSGPLPPTVVVMHIDRNTSSEAFCRPARFRLYINFTVKRVDWWELYSPAVLH